eukprot:1345945-Rhodomonas_salina.1
MRVPIEHKRGAHTLPNRIPETVFLVQIVLELRVLVLDFGASPHENTATKPGENSTFYWRKTPPSRGGSLSCTSPKSTGSRRRYWYAARYTR